MRTPPPIHSSSSSTLLPASTPAAESSISTAAAPPHGFAPRSSPPVTGGNASMRSRLHGELPPADPQQADPLAAILDRAAPVEIGGARFNLPVIVTGTHTAQVHFLDGSELHLIRPARGGAYVPVAGQPAPQVSSAADGSAGRPIDLLSDAPAENSSADFNLPDFGVADALHLPLFGLEQEREGEKAQFIKPEPVDAAGSGLRTGRRAASGSPEADEDGARHQHKRARPDEQAGAAQRWSAYCTTRGGVWLPAWAALDKNQQLLLQAAAVSLPGKKQYAEDHLHAEQAGAPVTGQAIVQAHSDRRFKALASDIAAVTQRMIYSIQNQQARIDALGEPAFKNIAQTMLDDAKTDPALRGGKPDTLKDSDPIRKLQSTMLFLKKVEEKATEAKHPSGAAWLQATLAAMVAGLPPEQRVAPDPETSNRCVTALAAALGIPESNVKPCKPAIKTLTGVDLAFHNAARASAAAPAADNPIPPYGKGTTLHGRFEGLKCPANRTAFADFFRNRSTIPKAGDPPGKNFYAAPMANTMLLLEHLESRRDAAGHPALQDVDTWLKDLFGQALKLDEPITDWTTLGTPDKVQLKAIRATLQAQPEIRQKPSDFYPFILSLTGISLWTTLPKP